MVQRARVRSLAGILAATVIGLGVLGGPAAAQVPPTPHALPPAHPNAVSARGLPGSWIIGVDPRNRAATAFAARSASKRLTGLPAFVVATGRARALARSERRRGALLYSEPDVSSTRAQSAGPGSLAQYNGWRSYLVPNGLNPPAAGPLLVLIDSQVDLTHPAIQGGHIRSSSSAAPTDEHGTATSGLAAGLDSVLGFQGVWPGANTEVVVTDLSCTSVAQGVLQAVTMHAAVINMSLGSPQPCFTLYLSLMAAVGAGVLPVASAGNEFLQGNPISFPASFPHMLTVAAVSLPSLAPAFFSTRNLGVDLAAPGVKIVSPVPPQFDTDSDRDGWLAVSGTSASAPMVAALATWIKAIRPDLDGQQIATLLRSTAKPIYLPLVYNPDTGYGLPQLAAALQAPTPNRSLFEPNDDIPLVDGQFFGQPDPFVWTGAGSQTIVGGLDLFKNPADVYRVQVPGHSVMHVRLRAQLGIVTLAVFGSRAKTTAAHPIARRRIRRTGAVVVRNRGGTAVMYVQAKTASVGAIYHMTIGH
ncbi:MAG TPA: S8 family serine peptidase [Solirubrobacteraceae bacterium]|nr:S8 family serine peptidase [Solirubrobacteraceae bacterium]